MRHYNYLKTFALVAIIGFAGSCEDEVKVATEATFLVSDVAVSEAGCKTYTFGVKLDAPAASDVTLSIAASGSATAGSDYALPETATVIKAGESTGLFSVKVFADNAAEEAETIGITLSSAEVAVSGSYTITIAKNAAMNRDSFLGIYDCDEPGYKHYLVEMTADPVDPQAIIVHNFWDSGGLVKYVFDPATNKLVAPLQDVTMGGTVFTVAVGTGVAAYEPCGKTFAIPYRVRLKSSGATQDINVHTFVRR